MAEEEKTNDIPEDVTPDDAVADNESADGEVETANSATETTEETKSATTEDAPVRKKDRSKIYLDSKQTAEKKKKKEPGKVRRWFKDFFSELKKVTWPSFSQVLKQTGTVLLVTVCFLLVLMAFDSLFGFLYRLLVGEISVTETVTAAAAMLSGGGLL